MSPDVVITNAPAAPSRLSPQQSPPLHVLVIAPSLVPDEGTPAPVEFVNALAGAGMRVMFAAAVGPLRTELSRDVRYLLIDDAGNAPIKTAHELSRIIRHHQPDVVHFHGARCALVGALAVKASHVGCARVMTHVSPLGRIPDWIKGPLLRRCADRYFAADATLGAELEALHVPQERIQVESVQPDHAPAYARDSIAAYRSLVQSGESS